MRIRALSRSALLSSILSIAALSFAQVEVNPHSMLPASPAGKHWVLAWSDEFDGTAIDPAKWKLPGENIPRSSGVWSNNNVSVSGGMLRFRVERLNGLLSSAAISSEDRFETTYGYFEIRAKMPKHAGYRPAFWITSRKINIVNSPQHPTEIDVFEYPSRDGQIHLNLHWNGYGADHRTVGTTTLVPTASSEFHTYGVWWDQSGYRFYIDGRAVWTNTGGGASSGPEFIRLGNELFTKEILVNGKPANDFPTDDDFVVDYVRVYKLQ